jgi:LacI family transcriptional regulator
MTYSIVEPHVHRVVTHHFDNAVRTFTLLEQQGYSRIGLAMTHDMEFRANHSYSGAYYRMTSMDGLKALPILYLDNPSRPGIRAWFTKHRPQVVIVANSHQVHDFMLPGLTQRLRDRIAFRSLDYESNAGIPGIDQLFETIGSHAVDTLVAQIHRNERGLPENPTVTMVKGRWVEA